MSCETCGEPTKTVESEGATTSGHFREKVKCVNDHVGYVEGDASDNPEKWTRYGPVFEEY